MPRINIIVPANWRTVAGLDTARLACDASTVRAALEWLTATYPPLLPRVFTDEGRLTPVVNVFVGDDDIRHLDALDTPLDEAMTLTVIPALVGG